MFGWNHETYSPETEGLNWLNWVNLAKKVYSIVDCFELTGRQGVAFAAVSLFDRYLNTLEIAVPTEQMQVDWVSSWNSAGRISQETCKSLIIQKAHRISIATYEPTWTTWSHKAFSVAANFLLFIFSRRACAWTELNTPSLKTLQSMDSLCIAFWTSIPFESCCEVFCQSSLWLALQCIYMLCSHCFWLFLYMFIPRMLALVIPLWISARFWRTHAPQKVKKSMYPVSI